MSSHEPVWPAQVDLVTRDILNRLDEVEAKVNKQTDIQQVLERIADNVSKLVSSLQPLRRLP